MQVVNVRYYENMSFEDYLALPGYSYSGLKHGGAHIEETPKMRLGTAVHNYLLTPKYVTEINERVRQMAVALKTTLGGSLLKHLKAELVVTADFVHEGFVLKYKGRIDLCVPGKMVIDLKVTDLQIIKAIEHFGYDRQISGYCLGTSSPLGFLLSVKPMNNSTNVSRVAVSSQWWEQKTLQYGTPMFSTPIQRIEDTIGNYRRDAI
jgi:hypothetical protein